MAWLEAIPFAAMAFDSMDQASAMSHTPLTTDVPLPHVNGTANSVPDSKRALIIQGVAKRVAQHTHTTAVDVAVAIANVVLRKLGPNASEDEITDTINTQVTSYFSGQMRALGQ